MGVQKVMVAGAGSMGGGIAQTCAQAGIEVLITDAAEQAREKSLKNIAEDRRFYPPLLLCRKVKAGNPGRKTGKGRYEYNEDGTRKTGHKSGI